MSDSAPTHVDMKRATDRIVRAIEDLTDAVRGVSDRAAAVVRAIETADGSAAARADQGKQDRSHPLG